MVWLELHRTYFNSSVLFLLYWSPNSRPACTAAATTPLAKSWLFPTELWVVYCLLVPEANSSSCFRTIMEKEVCPWGTALEYNTACWIKMAYLWETQKQLLCISLAFKTHIVFTCFISGLYVADNGMSPDVMRTPGMLDDTFMLLSVWSADTPELSLN